MFGKYALPASVAILCAALISVCLVVSPGEAYRVCTFKGMVIDHGWRSMTVKSNGQCAELNVGWRTKYLPNRRPCLGERVAVDFVLEDGYMKATKVVSLSPLPQSVSCYPPPPPSGTTCRSVGGDGPSGGIATDACPSPRAVCSSRPPAHVADPSWSPGKEAASDEQGKAPQGTATKKQPPDGKRTVRSAPPTAPPEPQEPAGPKEPPSLGEKPFKSLAGEVVASSPKSLSLRVVGEGESAEVVNIRVGLKTKFIPFRRPSVGEKVKVEFQQENGDKFGYTVRVVQ